MWGELGSLHLAEAVLQDFRCAPLVGDVHEPEVAPSALGQLGVVLFSEALSSSFARIFTISVLGVKNPKERWMLREMLRARGAEH